MLLKLLFFVLGQVVLLGGCWWSFNGLIKRHQLLTIWGALISTWYGYLLVWYGPTSLFGVLGPDFVAEAAAHPWWLRVDMLVPSLANAFLLQGIPLILNYLFFSEFLTLPNFFSARLEPILGHKSCLWFGLLGTLAQFYSAVFFGDLWLRSQFDFGALLVLQKSVLSGFFMFTVGPQISLLFYRYCRRDKFLSPSALNSLVIISILVAIYSFAAFGQRTYVLFEIIFLCYIVLSASGRYKLLIAGVVPFALFIGYAFTSMQARINVSLNPLEIASVAGKRLVDDLAYRSHIANDGVMIGARACVLEQLNELGLSKEFVLPIELASGLPHPIRQLLPLDIGSARLEALVGNCYRRWLDMPDANIDLTDSKVQYFLITFGQITAPFISTAFWLILGLIYILSVYLLFLSGLRLVAFAIPAATHFLVLGTTPGEVFVVIKALLPYFAIIALFSFLNRIFRKSSSSNFV